MLGKLRFAKRRGRSKSWAERVTWRHGHRAEIRCINHSPKKGKRGKDAREDLSARSQNLCEACKRRWEETAKEIKIVEQEVHARWFVPYWQLEQCLFRPGSVVGPLLRDGAPSIPELDRIWIVRWGAFNNSKRALVLSPPDHIARDLSIPASMKESLGGSDG